jgi:hypothetical protein
VPVVEPAAAFWQRTQRHYVDIGRPTNELVAMKVVQRNLREPYAARISSTFWTYGIAGAAEAGGG